MELVNQLEQNLSQHQLQSLSLLQLNEAELEQFVYAQVLDNPVMDVENIPAFSDGDRKQQEWSEQLKWLQGHEDQSQYHFHAADARPNLIEYAHTQGGFEETLEKHLNTQIDAIEESEELRMLLYYLVEELDEDGYLRASAEDLAKACGSSEESARLAIARLKRLEPAGVGAFDFKERLLLQLERKGASAAARLIVQNHLEDLAHKRYRRIEKALHLDQSSFLRAQAEIQSLNPHVGNRFERQEDTVYIRPDVYVEEEAGTLQAHLVREDHPYYTVNNYYLDLYRTTQDAEVRSYLKEKLSQAYTLLFFISQRERTILRCANLLIERQQAFFREGAALVPFTMAETAEALGVHPSTVSRTVKNKYLQCSRGVFPLRYFFEKKASAPGDTAMGSQAIKERILKHISNEDPKDPLSDREITERLTVEGCVISRRTVAKYREELQIAGRSERRQP